MQIADRFHLHQNLLEAIKKALNRELPATIKISNETMLKENEPTEELISSDESDRGKKMPSTVDNPPILDQKRYQLILQIQAFVEEGCSLREIGRRLGISRNTASKFKSGDPVALSEYGYKPSKLDVYRSHIIACLHKGFSKIKTTDYVSGLGYTGSSSNTYDYLIKVEEALNMKFEPQPYVRTLTRVNDNHTGTNGENESYITRAGVFKHLWMNTKLSEYNRKYIFEKYPVLYKIKNSIDEFRQMFKLKNVSWLYLFIERHLECGIKELSSFSKGLLNDIDAVENAIAYNYSNGFVEGTNSKLKMVKRTMYGRCKMSLLSAKMMMAVEI